MGLSIHYSGSFDPSASLREMIDEVVEVAKVFHWKYKIYKKVFPENNFINQYDENIYGVIFIPPSCEPVYLSFLSNGRISTEMYLKVFGNPNDKDYHKYLYTVSTKTQYSGIKTHMSIIHFLKYISAKYLKEFQLTDEGKYWETGDEKLLEATFKSYNDILDSLSDALEISQINTEESIEEYLNRVIDQVNKRRKDL